MDAVGSRTASCVSGVPRGSRKVAPAAWVTPRRLRVPDLPWSSIETVGKPQPGRTTPSLGTCETAVRRLVNPAGRRSRQFPSPGGPETKERASLTIFHNCLRGAGGSLPLRAGGGVVTREEPASGCALKGDRVAAAASGNRAGRLGCRGRRSEAPEVRGRPLRVPNLVEPGEF